jgi:hypothetical protein
MLSIPRTDSFPNSNGVVPPSPPSPTKRFAGALSSPTYGPLRTQEYLSALIGSEEEATPGIHPLQQDSSEGNGLGIEGGINDVPAFMTLRLGRGQSIESRWR